MVPTCQINFLSGFYQTESEAMYGYPKLGPSLSLGRLVKEEFYFNLTRR